MSLFRSPLTEEMFCKDTRTVRCGAGDVKFCFDQIVGIQNIPDALYTAFANYAEERGYSKQRSDVARYISSYFYRTFPCYLNEHGPSDATCRAYANKFANDMIDATGTDDVRQPSFDWAYYWSRVALDMEQNKYSAFAAEPVVQASAAPNTATPIPPSIRPAVVVAGAVCCIIALYMILKTWGG